MDSSDVSPSPGPFLWASLFGLCGVSWFITFYVALPAYGYVIAVLYYGDSFIWLVAAALCGFMAFFLMDLLLPSLVVGAAVAAVRLPEGRCYLFNGTLGQMLCLLCVVHLFLLLTVVVAVFYLKYVVDLGGTWPWLTFAACLWGVSASLVCCRFFFTSLGIRLT